MITKIAIAIAFLTGLGLIFIGLRFLITPEVAELGYGIHFSEQADHSFHYMKGIRDTFSGLLICILSSLKQKRALALTLLAATMVPVADMLIVLNKSEAGILQAMPHIIAVFICAAIGLILLFIKQQK